MSLFEEIFGVSNPNKSYWDYRSKEDEIDVKKFEKLINMLTRKADNIQDQIKEYFSKNKIQINKNDLKKCIREILAEDFANEGDTYDIVRDFALEAIGVKENGKISPEFVKLVRQEMANVAAKNVERTEDTGDDAGGITNVISINSINKLLSGYNLKLNVRPDESFEIIKTGKYGPHKS